METVKIHELANNLADFKLLKYKSTKAGPIWAKPKKTHIKATIEKIKRNLILTPFFIRIKFFISKINNKLHFKILYAKFKVC